MKFPRSILLPLLIPTAVSLAADPPQETRRQAAEAMRAAVAFFHEQASSGGGYVWQYSADLSKREGEAAVDQQTVWVQPPGTPAVGMALLRAYAATGEPYYREAARDAGGVLLRGQLQSGGWDYRIELAQAQRKRYAYRSDGRREGRNRTTLDDDNTQAAVRFLMLLDRALAFKDEKIHEAVQYALECLLKAQYPNGAWPQRYEAFADPEDFPVKQASFPREWSRKWPRQKYYHYYTLNDNTLADLIDTTLLAAEIYEQPRYRQAALRAGGFLILAQLPEPQPGWAQQYNPDMHPAWARKFEPPAITGSESQQAMQILLKLYQASGDEKFLQPIPKALAYYRKSLLPGDRLARFYELGSNKPLYFTRDYKLTYRDDHLPTHYGFKVSSKLDRIERKYQRLKQTDPQELSNSELPSFPKFSADLQRRAQRVIAALDQEGRWTEKGSLKRHADTPGGVILRSRTFIENVEVLADYLAATRGK